MDAKEIADIYQKVLGITIPPERCDPRRPVSALRERPPEQEIEQLKDKISKNKMSGPEVEASWETNFLQVTWSHQKVLSVSWNSQNRFFDVLCESRNYHLDEEGEVIAKIATRVAQMQLDKKERAAADAEARIQRIDTDRKTMLMDLRQPLMTFLRLFNECRMSLAQCESKFKRDDVLDLCAIESKRPVERQWFGVEEIDGETIVFAQLVTKRVHDIDKGDIRWVCVLTWEGNAECMKTNDHERMEKAIEDVREGFRRVASQKSERKARERVEEERRWRLYQELNRQRQQEIERQERDDLADALSLLHGLEQPFQQVAVNACVSHERFRKIPELRDEIRDLFDSHPLATIKGTDLSNRALINLIQGAVEVANRMKPNKSTKSAQRLELQQK